MLLGATLGALLLAPADARAVDTTVAPGQELTLTADLVLDTADSFLAGGEASQPRCKIHGAGHGIHTAADPNGGNPWMGSFSIRNCDIDGLGTADDAAIDVRGGGAAIVEGSIFSTSGLVAFGATGSMSVAFRNNRIEENAAFPAVTLASASAPAFYATGSSTATKLFQGNVVLKGFLLFQGASDWLVGGDTAAEGNVLVGLRAGIHMENASRIVVRNNYSHTLIGEIGWNQVKNVSALAGGDIIIEHNILRGYNWLTELNAGVELRYNLLFDAVERGWVLMWAKAGVKVHHNVLVAMKDGQFSPAGVFVLEDDGNNDLPPTSEVYNNTIDAGGVCNPGLAEGAVVFHGPPVLASLRSNVFSGMRVSSSHAASLMRDPGSTDTTVIHLGYSDYNLFHNPDSPVKAIYGVGVSDGFGAHDIPMSPTSDMAIGPGFAAQIPRAFPFGDDALIARTATTCQVLAYYRKVYTPQDGSPLIDRGDPMEGAGNDIGAVGAGTDNPVDRFGRLCDPQDIGQPMLTASTYTCPSVPLGVSGGGGGGVIPPNTSRGITCVCEVAPVSGASTGAETLLLLVAGAVVLSTVRRRRR